MKTLTIRNVPPELARALEEEKQRRGKSINQLVLDLLSSDLGTRPGRVRSNGLAKLAGSWSKEELEQFEKSVSQFDAIDADLWE